MGSQYESFSRGPWHLLAVLLLLNLYYCWTLFSSNDITVSWWPWSQGIKLVEFGWNSWYSKMSAEWPCQFEMVTLQFRNPQAKLFWMQVLSISVAQHIESPLFDLVSLSSQQDKRTSAICSFIWVCAYTQQEVRTGKDYFVSASTHQVFPSTLNKLLLDFLLTPNGFEKGIWFMLWIYCCVIGRRVSGCSSIILP